MKVKGTDQTVDEQAALNPFGLHVQIVDSYVIPHMTHQQVFVNLINSLYKINLCSCKM